MTEDLMFQDRIREIVHSTYGRAPSGAGRALASKLYDADQLERVPEKAVEWALGVGNPVRHADLQPGEVVLDLGCGGGIDSILAAHAVGPTGRVIGIDALEEMRERTESAAEEAGVSEWCTAVRAEMEDLPLPDDSVDVVISNGVPNLSPRKSRMLSEVARVLRPGGRFCVADLTIDQDLPPEVLTMDAAWASCIGGALSEDLFTRKLEKAGLTDVEIGERRAISIDDLDTYPLFIDELIDTMRTVVPSSQQNEIATSVIVKARQPE